MHESKIVIFLIPTRPSHHLRAILKKKHAYHLPTPRNTLYVTLPLSHPVFTSHRYLPNPLPAFVELTVMITGWYQRRGPIRGGGRAWGDVAEGRRRNQSAKCIALCRCDIDVCLNFVRSFCRVRFSGIDIFVPFLFVVDFSNIVRRS